MELKNNKQIANIDANNNLKEIKSNIIDNENKVPSTEVENVDFANLYTDYNKGFNVSKQDLLSVANINDNSSLNDVEILQ